MKQEKINLTGLSDSLQSLFDCREFALMSGSTNEQEVPFDCWWRCLAMMFTKGQDFSKEKAKEYAQSFWGDNFNDDCYGMYGYYQNFYTCLNNFKSGKPASSYYSGTILLFDTGYKITVNNKEYPQFHAVIITHSDLDDVYYIDPSDSEPQEVKRISRDNLRGFTFRLGNGVYNGIYKYGNGY